MGEASHQPDLTQCHNGLDMAVAVRAHYEHVGAGPRLAQELQNQLVGLALPALRQRWYDLRMTDSLDQAQGPSNPENDLGFQGIIRPVQTDDLPALRPILEQCMVQHETGILQENEVIEALDSVEQSLQGANSRQYVVAEDTAGVVVGMMGLDVPEGAMQELAATENPAEIVNAYVSADTRFSGTGKALVARLEETARAEGRTELLVNSGPRYEKSGWRFWTSMFGEPIHELKDYYGPGYRAMVWRKPLPRAE
ncbi:MAG TPA: GNAT family N-acetyltransferase [Candidatus Saccharibacteria bacterium]|nr:GNAT family N-acetyltransferase [Candidatus Saccharibacteria bacterium]